MIARAEILDFMRAKAYRPLTADELVAALRVRKAEEEAFRELLKRMEREGEVVRTRYGRYGVPERMNLVVGVFQGHEKGFGFVAPLDPAQPELFIPPKAMGGAMHGDRVVARISSAPPAKGLSPEGEVIRILQRVNTRITGILERHKGYGFVTPDDRRLPFAVLVTGKGLREAGTGDKVVVEVTEWPGDRRGPAGRVVERLGRAGDPGVDVLSLIHRYGLPLRFPQEVQSEAEGISLRIDEADMRGRLDLRNRLVVTIDGEDAKDFDDAVSLEILGEGEARWRLGVHIADVSHYVREGRPLDKEARERGTSIYLVDRVIPMLPERLSNGICSLNPGEDRLTLSVFMDIDDSGRILHFQIHPSVIRSRARLTYTEAWRVIREGGVSINPDAQAVRITAAPEEARGLPGMLVEMNKLAETLRQKRLQRGSIDFDLPEARVQLDPGTGAPLEIAKAERTPAHQLIEEFMLAANEVVAEYCSWLKVPFIYRVHEEPAAEKVEALSALLHNLGIAFRPSAVPHPRDFQRVLERVKGRPEENLVSAVMLRSMKQARYAAENLGHFGLAARFYCHFTSPIRRYPDLVAHRVVKSILSRGLNEAVTGRWQASFPEVASHCSSRERLAAEAEMETVKLKMAQYMAGRVGEVFPGIISGVTAFGFFVQLENLVEGLVHVSTFADDYYQYDEKGHFLLGERSGRRFRLGDPVKVKVAGVNPSLAQIDFNLVEGEVV